MNSFSKIAVLLSLVYLGACSNNDSPSPSSLTSAQLNTIDRYLQENDIEAELVKDRFYYTVDTSNSGGASAAGNILQIYYTASVLNGQVLESQSLSQGEAPVLLAQGENAVVPVGLDEGLALMRDGETFTFYLPSSLAYGSASFSTLLPENSIIVIQVQIVGTQSLIERLTDETGIINAYITDNDLNNTTANPLDPVQNLVSGIWFKRLSLGYGTENPTNGDFMTIRYQARHINGQVFDATNGNETFQFNLNSDIVIPGLDAGVANMLEGERALLIIPSNQGYASSARVIPAYLKDALVEDKVIPDYVRDVDPFDILLFEVTLVSVD